MKRSLSALLTLALLLGLLTGTASAKTISSAKADNVFFYALNDEGKSVLLKVLPLSELKALAHGQANGDNYSISTTDNYPTTQYCEGVGFTVKELVDYVQSVTEVPGAEALDFSGGDTLRLMATDSYGNYSRSWSYDQLYGVKRYYFEGLYDSWHTGWEIAGEDNSKFGVSLDEYNRTYKDSDPYYADKRRVFDSGVETTVILMTESYSGRTTGETLVASTEPGIAAYIAENGGKTAGSLKNALTDAYALRLSLPMTEADLMAAHRTAYDNFKWIYNIRLDREAAPALPSLGTVSAPEPVFTLSGDTLTVSFSCSTPGAEIYYGWEGAALTRYIEPLTIDVSGRDLASDPVTVYASAVREGYDDLGMQTYRYPGMAPQLQTVYSGMCGSTLTFTASESVSSSDWAAWTAALGFITMKAPGAGGYIRLGKDKYTVRDEEKTLSFDGTLFTDTGSYSFILHALGFADKAVSVTMKKAAPLVTAAESVPFGGAVTLSFDDAAYQTGLSVYVTAESGARTMISASWLDRTQPGQVTIKADYFAAASTAMPEPGVYALELVNNRYTPGAQSVTVMLAAGFADVPESAWYYSYITDLAAAGVINGVGNGLFDPGGTLTWGQAAKLLLLTAGYDEQPPTGKHWASGYLDKAVADGLLPSLPDPNGSLTRLEFCQMAASALSLETAWMTSPFTDTDDPGVLALNEQGIIDGVGDGRFDPASTLTRAQISAVIWRIRNMEVSS